MKHRILKVYRLAMLIALPVMLIWSLYQFMGDFLDGVSSAYMIFMQMYIVMCLEVHKRKDCGLIRSDCTEILKAYVCYCIAVIIFEVLKILEYLNGLSIFIKINDTAHMIAGATEESRNMVKEAFITNARRIILNDVGWTLMVLAVVGVNVIVVHLLLIKRYNKERWTY